MNASQLKCPNCGAVVGYNPATQKFLCDFCGSEFTEKSINAANATNSVTIDGENNFSEHTNLYQCQSCGAEIVADENTAATFCHYCHGAVLLKGQVSGELQPELILPFKKTKKDAEEIFDNWCKKKWFLPREFKSDRQLEKMVGLYVPFWLADCTVDASVECKAEHIHSYISGDYDVKDIREYHTERAGKLEYKGVPADGSKKLEDDLMDAIEPFDYNEFQSFDMSYFSGFYADKYDVDKETVFPRIKERLQKGSEKVLMDDIKGYTTVTCQHKEMKVKKTAWHYAMLPVWFMTYIHKDKKYLFAINGQTGKVAGAAPVSDKKLILLAGIILSFFTLMGLLFALGGVAL